jgi:hypothetical protein
MAGTTIYILPFYNDQLIAKKVAGLVDNSDGSLELIKITTNDPVRDRVKSELESYNINVDKNRISDDCGTIPKTTSRFVIYKTNVLPTHRDLKSYNIGNKNLFEVTSRNIFEDTTQNFVKIILDCKNSAPNPPSDDDSNINIIIRRPFLPAILGPFAPYGFWPFSPTVRVTTPYSSPIVRIPFFSLPRPDFGFVPAVVPTFTQPVLSPHIGNPFPRRVSEPSPMNKNLFEEKPRPVHMRSKRLGMNGGYYEKYLKYKNKYLELKDQLENQV